MVTKLAFQRLFHRPRRIYEETASKMLSPREVDFLRKEIASTAHEFLKVVLPPSEHLEWQEVYALTADFISLYDQRPVRDNNCGSQFSDCYWIFCLANALRPDVIIVSGVYRGQSSWIFRQARPMAEIHCFDINLRNLVYRDPDITYHETDWINADVPSPRGARTLCFFDDHINQALRVRQAFERGFRHLLFDDDLPLNALHAVGNPPVPTINMLFDRRLAEGDVIEWLRKGRYKCYVHHEDNVHGARDLIVSHAHTPDISRLLNYRPQGGITFVRLRGTTDKCEQDSAPGPGQRRAPAGGGEQPPAQRAARRDLQLGPRRPVRHVPP